jgi:hypothetical protein
MRSTDPRLFSADDTPSITEDSSSGPGAPDLELVFISGVALRHRPALDVQLPPGCYWSMRACLLRCDTVEIYLLLHG